MSVKYLTSLLQLHDLNLLTRVTDMYPRYLCNGSDASAEYSTKKQLCSTLQTGGVLQIPASTSHLLHIQERHLFECLKKTICNKWHEGVNWTEHDDYWLYPCGHMTSWHTWVDKCFVDLIMVFTCRLQSVEMAVEPSKSQCHLWDQFSDWAAKLHDVEFASFFASGTLHGTKQSATLFKLDWFAITQQ